VVHFPLSEKSIRYKLSELKSDLFLDKSTRSIRFIVPMFNANLRLFTVIDFIIKMDAAGHINTKVYLSSLRQNNFVTTSDFVRFVLELLLLSIVIIHSYRELRVALLVGLPAYMNFWNTVDTVRQVTSFFFFVNLLWSVSKSFSSPCRAFFIFVSLYM
jgi:hypothetical protein